MIRHHTPFDRPRGFGGPRRERIVYSNRHPEGRRWQEPLSPEEVARALRVMQEQRAEHEG